MVLHIPVCIYARIWHAVWKTMAARDYYDVTMVLDVYWLHARPPWQVPEMLSQRNARMIEVDVKCSIVMAS